MVGSQPSSHQELPLMIDDPLEEIKTYSQKAFLGEVACGRERCPHCNSPTLFRARVPEADLPGSGGCGGALRAGVCAAV